MKPTVIMLMSGGIESAVVAALLAEPGGLYSHDVRRAMIVNYGQRAWDQELKAATYLCNRYGMYLEIVDMTLPFLSEHSLVAEDKVAVYTSSRSKEPSRGHIVPFRNLVFLSAAVSYAASVAPGELVRVFTGFEFAPNVRGAAQDTSPGFQWAFQEVIDIAAEGTRVEVVSPLNEEPVGKSANVKRGYDLDVDFARTWSCYNDYRLPCGGCGSCVERRVAFAALKLEDPAGLMPLEDCEVAIQLARDDA